ncbi:MULTISPECIES: hypothetical protein [Saccharibacillus]|uniref:hypothetical protein n=1 Tax=Saccharibacillus TaxID=456492 RepID=UPI00123BE2F7|nr:hypothetical protein [Saccharibacillus sp. WB 17]MWJ31379.1 hypothetical protein [Saccharibacillus sp. WB 17]
MENNKYPENYFEHYIISFSGIGYAPNKVGFEKLAKLYMDIEGINEFFNLIKEIQIVKENNDWSHFESIAEDFEIEGLDIFKLKELVEVTINIFNNIKV